MRKDDFAPQTKIYLVARTCWVASNNQDLFSSFYTWKDSEIESVIYVWAIMKGKQCVSHHEREAIYGQRKNMKPEGLPITMRLDPQN